MKTGLSLGRVVRASPKRFEKRSELYGACQKSRKENSAGRGHSAGKGLEAGKSWARQENETQGLEDMQGWGVGIWHKMHSMITHTRNTSLCSYSPTSLAAPPLPISKVCLKFSIISSRPSHRRQTLPRLSHPSANL